MKALKMTFQQAEHNGKEHITRNPFHVKFFFSIGVFVLSMNLFSCGSGGSPSAVPAPPAAVSQDPASVPPTSPTPPAPSTPVSFPLSGQVLPSSPLVHVKDTIPPKIASTLPENGETFVTKSTVTVLFSEPIDPATLTVDTFWISAGNEKLSGEILKTMAVGDPSGVAAATFRPSQNLLPFTDYKANVSTNIKDLAGNAIPSAYSWTFKTGTVDDSVAPTVLSILPSNDAANVLINKSIQVTFSEVMDPGSITLGSFIVGRGEQRLQGSLLFEVDPTLHATVVTFLYEDPLQYDTNYTVTLTRAIKDGAGNTLANDFTSHFKTAPSASAGGKTFLQPIRLSGSNFTSGFQFEVDPLGRIYALWQESSGIQFSRSINGGAEFSLKKNIIPNGMIERVAGNERGLDLSVTLTTSEQRGGTVYQHVEVAYVRSTDAGDHFSVPLTVSSVDDFQSMGSSIARANNLVGIVWEDYVIPLQGAGFSGFNPIVMFRRSLNDGDTFSAPVSLSGLQTVGHSPKIAISSSQDIYVAWTDEFGNGLFSRSLNSGATFSAPVQILSAADQIGLVQMTVEANETIDLVWSKGSPLDQKIFLSKSTDKGNSFGPPSPLSFTSDIPICSSVRISPTGQILASWTVGDAFSNAARSFFSTAQNGVTFSAPAQIPVMNGIAGCPVGRIDPSQSSNLHFLWSNYPYGSFTPNIYYGKAVSSAQ